MGITMRLYRNSDIGLNEYHSVNIETFPGYKRAGIVHSYLEEYDVRK